jgi:sec-independent protein translocase protein TatB
MFDISWSEFAIIAVVALIAIGPKELPGVLRMVGQWMGKARKMAAEFQGQFQEAMREAEMADLKKSFDEVREAATGFASGNVMTSLQKDVASALNIDDIDKPAANAEAASSPEASANIQAEAEADTGISDMGISDTGISQPLAITPEAQPHPAMPDHPATPDPHSAAVEVEAPRDAKAS